MQQPGQAPYLDQNDAHEQSLGQSDGSLPGPEQTLNQSINQQQAVNDPADGTRISALVIRGGLSLFPNETMEVHVGQHCVP